MAVDMLVILQRFAVVKHHLDGRLEMVGPRIAVSEGALQGISQM